MRRASSIPQRFLYCGARALIVIVPAHITQKGKKLIEGFLVIDPSRMLKTVFYARMQLRQAPLWESDTDNRDG